MSRSSRNVALGFEVGTGELVEIPIRNMVVTGQTQEAGKTTTLEALISRAGVSAVAFVTKRGEGSFAGARRIAPYFRERADWQFVQAVLEATLREKMRFERSWIMRASKGAKSLADVQRNVRKAMETAKGMSADVYLTLDAYLDIVVPRIARVKFAPTVDLKPGLNVIDMSDRDSFPVEIQGLVMRSVLEWVYEHAERTVTIIPEAWEFCPQGRGSPVKLAAVELVRKGSGLGNYVWLDSQDIGGVDKEVLRSCPVWLLGVQREANEIKRVLTEIPAGISKPKASDVATLEKGEFFACHGKHVVKTYVQPAWMRADQARERATGDFSAVAAPPADTDQNRSDPIQSDPIGSNAIKPEEDFFMTSRAEEKLDTLIELLTTALQSNPRLIEPPDAREMSQPPDPTKYIGVAGQFDEETLYQRFKERLTKEAPAVLKVLGKVREIDVEMEVVKITSNTATLHGMIALLIAEGFMNEPKAATDIWRETGRRFAYKGKSVRAYEQLDVLHKQGFIILVEGGTKAYQAVPGMKVNIVRT